MKQEKDGDQHGSRICTLAIWTWFFNLPLHWIPHPGWKRPWCPLTFLRGGVEMLQEVAAKHLLFVAPFSPDPPHPSLLQVGSDSTQLDDDDTSSAEGISKVLCCRCFCLVCYRTWCCWRPVSGSFAALESLYHNWWLTSHCIARFIFSSAKRTEFEAA